MEENKTNYSLESLSEFRKSIAKMGTTVPNGNVILDSTNNRREPRLDIDSILRTPYKDKASWRLYSRIFYGDSLYRRLLKYLSEIHSEQCFAITHDDSCFSGYPVQVISTTPEEIINKEKYANVIYL